MNSPFLRAARYQIILEFGDMLSETNDLDGPAGNAPDLGLVWKPQVITEIMAQLS